MDDTRAVVRDVRGTAAAEAAPNYAPIIHPSSIVRAEKAEMDHAVSRLAAEMPKTGDATLSIGAAVSKGGYAAASRESGRGSSASTEKRRLMVMADVRRRLLTERRGPPSGV